MKSSKLCLHQKYRYYFLLLIPINILLILLINKFCMINNNSNCKKNCNKYIREMRKQ